MKWGNVRNINHAAYLRFFKYQVEDLNEVKVANRTEYENFISIQVIHDN